ncbi:MFAP4 protein, partial [Amia calva]|nr:MFAP4 protein [Amia calva]
ATPCTVLVPLDCEDIYRYFSRVSGVYHIYPAGPYIPVNVYCDMETDGGKWTVSIIRLCLCRAPPDPLFSLLKLYQFISVIFVTSYANGVSWYHWKGHYYSLKTSEMKIRPVAVLLSDE